MAKPAQGDVSLLQDPRAQALLEARVAAHLAYTWSDGTPHNTPIWFYWNGDALVVCGPSSAPRVGVLTDGAPVAVTIHSDDWPYGALLLRGPVTTHQADGIPRSTAAWRRGTSARSRVPPGATSCLNRCP